MIPWFGNQLRPMAIQLAIKQSSIASLADFIRLSPLS